MPQRVPSCRGPNHCVKVLDTEGHPIDWKPALTAYNRPNKTAELQQPASKLQIAANPSPMGMKKRELERSQTAPVTNLKIP